MEKLSEECCTRCSYHDALLYHVKSSQYAPKLENLPLLGPGFSSKNLRNSNSWKNRPISPLLFPGIQTGWKSNPFSSSSQLSPYYHSTNPSEQQFHFQVPEQMAYTEALVDTKDSESNLPQTHNSEGWGVTHNADSESQALQYCKRPTIRRDGV
jgi:hypothetical protein